MLPLIVESVMVTRSAGSSFDIPMASPPPTKLASLPVSVVSTIATGVFLALSPIPAPTPAWLSSKTDPVIVADPPSPPTASPPPKPSSTELWMNWVPVIVRIVLSLKTPPPAP